MQRPQSASIFIHLAFICLCLLCLTACTQPEQPWLGKPAPDERIRLGIRNPDARYLRSEVWESPDSAFEEVRNMPSNVSEYEFMEDGRILSLKGWYHGKFQETTQYEYNDHSQLISSEVRGPKGEFRSCIVTTYFPDGQLAEIQSFNEEKRLQRRTLYAYDEMHRLLQVKEFFYSRDSNGEHNRLLESKDYVYWADGAQSEVKTTVDGQWKSTESYIYGVLQETSLPHGYKQHYHYDTQGLLTVMETWDSTEKTMERSDYSYDGEGRPILENHFYEDSEFGSSIRTTYDVHGNVIHKEEKVKLEGEWEPKIVINLYDYSYQSLNEFGDWQTMICSKNGRETRRIERSFESPIVKDVE